MDVVYCVCITIVGRRQFATLNKERVHTYRSLPEHVHVEFHTLDTVNGRRKNIWLHLSLNLFTGTVFHPQYFHKLIITRIPHSEAKL